MKAIIQPFPHEFKWTVYPGRYLWFNASPNEQTKQFRGPFLVDVPHLSLDEPKVYNPMDVPKLFSIFSKTDPTEEGVLAFANEYGLLGGRVQIQVDIKEELKGLQVPVVDNMDLSASQLFQRWFTLFDTPGEPLDLWRREIGSVRWAFELYLAIKAGIPSLLADKLNPENPHPGILQKPEIFQYDLEHWQSVTDDRLHFARLMLNRVIETGLKGVVDIAFGSPDNEYNSVLGVYPTSLLGAIWLQLAETVALDKRYEYCRFCNEIIEQTSKKEKIYCNVNHRNRHYQQRKKEAAK